MPSIVLNPYIAAGLAAFLPVLLIFHYLLYPTFFSPLSKIPVSHWNSSISYSWINSLRCHGTGIKEILDAHRKYGPVVRLSPDEISVASLDGLRKIYLGGFEKTQWYAEEFENFGTPNMVSLLGNKPHAERKRMLSHVYSKSYLQNSEDVEEFAKVVLKDRLLPILNAAARDGSPLDVYSLNQALGLDLMSAYLFGIDNSTDFIRDIQARQAYTKNWMTKSKGLPGKESARQEIESLIASMCDAAQKSRQDTDWQSTHDQTAKPVVYSQLSSHLTKSEEAPRSAEELRRAIASELLDHLGAAHEATRITLTYILWHLSQHSNLQSGIRSEFANTRFSDVFGPLPIQAVPFSSYPAGSSTSAPFTVLTAVIAETMRLHPPAPSMLPRVVPPSGAVIDGYFVPGGTKIGCSAFCLHRNEDVFEDAETWNIWRWIPRNVNDEEQTERLKELRRWFWAFGSGGRVCIGKHFALWMLTSITATIYANFETEIVDDEGIEQEDAFFAGPKGERLILKLRAIV